MKPFGTITMDFSFIETSTREVLEKVLQESHNYAEFTKALGRIAISEDASDEIVLLAIRHANNLNLGEFELNILNSNAERRVVLPFLLSRQASNDTGWDLAIKATEEAIEQVEEDWLTFLYLLQLYWIAIMTGFGNPLEETTQIRIKEMLEKNPSLNCYSGKFHLYHVFRLKQEGDIPRALDSCTQGLKTAEIFDDKLYESQLLCQKAELIGLFQFGPGSTSAAKRILTKARGICETLGDIQGLMSLQSLIQVICHIRAEYSEANEINYSIIENRTLVAQDLDINLHDTAFILNELGNGREALEMAMLALEGAGRRPLLLPYCHMDVAWSLINLNRLDEAAHQMDLARDFILHSGIESTIAYEYMINGLLERARGDFQSAFHSFEKALIINERNHRYNRANSCLIKLAETEVLAFEKTSKNRDDEVAGKWHARLEKFGREMELPGVVGIELLLRGELRLKQGHEIEARDCIEKALQMADSPGLAFLKKRTIRVLNLF
ncbi:MAG: hypothetical protein OEV85_03800 [Candidatus Thorarchaeota archaeon]|nr:hypothetical protein [Candidatus Thorarchaeota archaeon]